MATRSRIGVELPDGKVKSVYCHNDGYISGVGQDLINMGFADPAEVEEFIDMGDRSTCELSYKEWRNENCPPRIDSSVHYYFDKSDIEEYGYLYTQEGEWLVKKAYPENVNMPELLETILKMEEHSSMYPLN